MERFEHYELEKGEDGTPVELGRGAMGVTYKAVHVDLHCPVTLKVISEQYLGDESARLRFLREACAAASVRHPNVASVFHLGRTGQNYFYAMEFVEGETLESLIKRLGRLEVKLALEIATQVASGLAAVHKQKLVHRDIKPSSQWRYFLVTERLTATMQIAQRVYSLAQEQDYATLKIRPIPFWQPRSTIWATSSPVFPNVPCRFESSVSRIVRQKNPRFTLRTVPKLEGLGSLGPKVGGPLTGLHTLSTSSLPPASNGRTLTSGFLANLRATTEEPEPQTMKS